MVSIRTPGANFSKYNAAEIYPAGRFLCLMGLRRLFLALIILGSSFYVLVRFSRADTYARNARRCFTTEEPKHKEDPVVFEDKIFQPLLTLYKKKAAGKLAPGKKKFKKGGVPRILLWANPFWVRYWHEQTSHIKKKLCPLPCKVIFNEKKIKTDDR
ncbi:uncharacterized protein [Palaemon carinicauda]|uniref:uncharacterized protein n=1 Tax=Palaemon carinicauda TaxID=392227 RepID=UPI0035B5C111